jgi:hypothetical protein
MSKYFLWIVESHIEYFDLIFNSDEVNEIANWIILATQGRRK